MADNLISYNLKAKLWAKLFRVGVKVDVESEVEDQHHIRFLAFLQFFTMLPPLYRKIGKQLAEKEKYTWGTIYLAMI